VLHYLHDVLGNVVALTNSVGQVVERYDYDPYGTTTIMDAAAVPLALKPIDPAAADGYYHDHDRDGDIDAADYTDLMDCVNSTPYDPMCIYTHDRTGDRRVDIVDVGVYLAYADDQGLAGGTSAPELVHYGRPLRLQFDADGDGRVDMFDWYAMQTCFTKNTTRCNYLFDDNGDGVVNFYDLANFKQAADGPQGGPGATQWRRKLVASRYGNPFMWTGQRYDATTGQYHFWARTYSPSLGRWMQRDPLEYQDGVNLSSYVGGNPVGYVDLYGTIGMDVPERWPAKPDPRNPIKIEPTSAGGRDRHDYLAWNREYWKRRATQLSKQINYLMREMLDLNYEMLLWLYLHEIAMAGYDESWDRTTHFPSVKSSLGGLGGFLLLFFPSSYLMQYLAHVFGLFSVTDWIEEFVSAIVDSTPSGRRRLRWWHRIHELRLLFAQWTWLNVVKSSQRLVESRRLLERLKALFGDAVARRYYWDKRYWDACH
jgi:RHS repeat-associated protein